MVIPWRFVPPAGGSAILGLVVATRPLGPISRAIAIACVIASWLAALALKRADVRAHASVVAAVAGVTAAGQVVAGPVYGIAVGLFLLGCLLAMRAARRRSVPRSAPRRATIILASVASTLIATFAATLPPLAAWVERTITGMAGQADDESTAFSTTMVLGATRGMLQSDTIVLRIDGARPEYLRGAVYDRYDGLHWITSGSRRQTTKREAKAPTAQATTRITLVRGAPNGADMRWFLPPDACDLGVSNGEIEIDRFAVARRARGDVPPSIGLRTTGCTVAPAENASPRAVDLEVGAAVRRALAPVASEWTAAASTDREKLRAIEHELGRWEYSLAVPRKAGLDPIVDFVTVHRAGHCEMFASAMVMMARTQGIPARVVGGYRVSEVNPMTGQAVVRDRNAHAWVEAWIEGAWRGFDPTPASALPGARSSTLDHLGDLFWRTVDRALTGLAKIGPFGWTGILAGLLALLVAIRALGRWFRARRGRRHVRSFALDVPLPSFDALAAALETAGHARSPSEPLESFAEGLAASGRSWSETAAEALRAYAGLRYGGIGDEVAVVRTLERAARLVRDGGRMSGGARPGA